MAKILMSNGEVKDISPKNGKDFSLEELKAIVGGYIDICETTEKGMILVIDEEGKLKGKDYNEQATKLYKYSFSNGKLVDVIVGDALYCKSKEVK